MSFCISMPHLTVLDYLWRSCDVLSIIKVAVAQYYIQFRIWWCYSHQNATIYYLQTNYYQHISIHSWDITISNLEKQTSAILEFYFGFPSQPFRHNLHVILHQAAEFSPNQKIQCGNVMSYLFFKMAAVATQYYFQFRICWCHFLQKVKIYQLTKFRRHISINGRDIDTTKKQMSAILEFYFRFRLQPFSSKSPWLSMHKISSKSVHNFFRYRAEI